MIIKELQSKAEQVSIILAGNEHLQQLLEGTPEEQIAVMATGALFFLREKLDNKNLLFMNMMETTASFYEAELIQNGTDEI